jgi:TPR repeat protein
MYSGHYKTAFELFTRASIQGDPISEWRIADLLENSGYLHSEFNEYALPNFDLQSGTRRGTVDRADFRRDRAFERLDALAAQGDIESAIVAALDKSERSKADVDRLLSRLRELEGGFPLEAAELELLVLGEWLTDVADDLQRELFVGTSDAPQAPSVSLADRIQLAESFSEAARKAVGLGSPWAPSYWLAIGSEAELFPTLVDTCRAGERLGMSEVQSGATLYFCALERRRPGALALLEQNNETSATPDEVRQLSEVLRVLVDMAADGNSGALALVLRSRWKEIDEYQSRPGPSRDQAWWDLDVRPLVGQAVRMAPENADSAYAIGRLKLDGVGVDRDISGAIEILTLT